MTGRVADAVPAHRRMAVGIGLQLVAVLAATTIVVATVIGIRVIAAADDVVRGSAEVTVASLDQLADTLDLAGELVVAVDGILVEVGDGLVATSAAFEDGTDALGAAAALADDAAPALGSATATLRSLEGVARTIDGTLSTLSSLPFGPEYDPDQSFAATVGRLVADLDPLPDSFAATADELEDVAISTAELGVQLDELTVAVGDASTQLADSSALIAEYRVTAARAREVADGLERGVGGELPALRVLVVLAGVLLAAGQVVPWLVGSALRAAAPEAA